MSPPLFLYYAQIGRFVPAPRPLSIPYNFDKGINCFARWRARADYPLSFIMETRLSRIAGSLSLENPDTSTQESSPIPPTVKIAYEIANLFAAGGPAYLFAGRISLYIAIRNY